MNKKEAIAHLEKLREDCREFVSIETKEEDIEALGVAIAALRETALEVPVQEQSVIQPIEDCTFIEKVVDGLATYLAIHDTPSKE